MENPLSVSSNSGMAILASLSSYYQPKTSRIYVQHIYLELMWPRCWIIRKIELYSILLQDRRQTPQIESLSDSGYNQRMLLRRADGIRSCTSVFPTILFLAIPLLNSCPCTHGSPLSAIFFGRSIVLTEQRATLQGLLTVAYFLAPTIPTGGGLCYFFPLLLRHLTLSFSTIIWCFF